jgi:hypothetical protein
MVRRGRGALLFCGFLLIAIGCARLSQGQFAYESLTGVVATSFLVLLGIFVIAAAILSQPKTRP